MLVFLPPDEEWATHEAAEVSREGDLLLVQPPWKSRGNHNPNTSHYSRGRSPSPRRNRQKQQNPSNNHQLRNLSPIRMVHQRAAPPPRRGRRASRDR